MQKIAWVVAALVVAGAFVAGVLVIAGTSPEPVPRAYPYYSPGALVTDHYHLNYSIIDVYDAREDTYTYHDAGADLHAGTVTWESRERRISRRADLQEYFPVCVTLHR
jgi:hypothetical protein